MIAAALDLDAIHRRQEWKWHQHCLEQHCLEPVDGVWAHTPHTLAISTMAKKNHMPPSELKAVEEDPEFSFHPPGFFDRLLGRGPILVCTPTKKSPAKNPPTKECDGCGHNAEPVMTGECCDMCNHMKVLVQRLGVEEFTEDCAMIHPNVTDTWGLIASTLE